MSNNQNVLLTGSEGLIGKSFIKSAASEYENIFSIDIKNTNKKNYYKCDITKEIQVKKNHKQNFKKKKYRYSY